MNKQAKSLEQLKKEFFDSYIDTKIPKDLQSSYRESIQSIKAGFEAGVRFMLTNYNIQPK